MSGRIMQFESRKTCGEINFNDVCRAIFNFLSLEVVKKTVFIVFIAALLTVIVVQSGTSHTPTVDVFVYCFVYSAWITMCLPWLVQNMTGKLLGMLIGVIVRLFAVDVGILAWSAFRGHRNILQRGLRMKPLFEPSMSWLAEAGYNLRYGVIISAIVASVISLLIDFYEKLSEESNIARKPTSANRKKAWLTSENYRPCETLEADRNPLNQHHCHCQDCEDQGHKVSKNSKFGSTVRFNIMDDIGGLKDGREEFPDCNRHLLIRTNDAEVDKTHKEGHQQEQNVGPLFSERKPQIIHSCRAAWKDGENILKNSQKDNLVNVSEPRPYSSISDSCDIGVVNADRVTPVSASQVKVNVRAKRGDFAMPSETQRGKNMRHGEENTKRDHVTDRFDENDRVKYGRKGHATESMEEALNESLRGLRKLRGKI